MGDKMNKYIETILYFIVPFTIAMILGYLDNNPRWGVIIGVGVGMVFAILHHFKII